MMVLMCSDAAITCICCRPADARGRQTFIVTHCSRLPHCSRTPRGQIPIWRPRYPRTQRLLVVHSDARPHRCTASSRRHTPRPIERGQATRAAGARIKRARRHHGQLARCGRGRGCSRERRRCYKNRARPAGPRLARQTSSHLCAELEAADGLATRRGAVGAMCADACPR